MDMALLISYVDLCFMIIYEKREKILSVISAWKASGLKRKVFSALRRIKFAT